ncbi:WXG100 family type VII secretion target [Kitasatospora sp. NPDC008050]|uniref:WXG100 family type VII secretion target n=1 Tax=Kitasatospora sp. NPDC008050 TaxID=3364021 RepID=UPI0036EAEAD7
MRAPDPTGNAYGWASAPPPAPLKPLPQIHADNPGAIGSFLDDVVKGVLEATGLLDQLDKVTGQPQALLTAAQTWQDQAMALRGVAESLRQGAGPVSQQWHGSASNAFGAHMGQVVAAIDATADDAANTAQIIGSAAAECQLAEDTVIGIIREAIEWIGMTVAAGFLADILTLGLASIVDGLVADAEITAFVGRVAKVSETLAEKLTKLQEAMKELREAEKLGKEISAANKARKVIKNIRTGDRELLKLKTYGSAYKGANLVGQLAVKPIKSGLAAPILGGLTGVHPDLKGEAEKLAGELDSPPPADPPAPYHVPGGRIEQAFG